MSDNVKYSSYAILYELSNRDFKRKLGLFPEELRYYVILANGIIGAENAKRMQDVPAGVAADGEEFVAKLSSLCDPAGDDIFKGVLKTCLIEALKDELRCCCPNCRMFNDCIDLRHLTALGDLFRRRTEGEETDELKKKIAEEIGDALKKTPYLDSDEADKSCADFQHQYPLSRLGELFGRYSDIGMGLKEEFGLDYRELQAEMVSLNMAFAEKRG